MAKNAYFGTDTGNFGTGTAMYASEYSMLNIKVLSKLNFNTNPHKSVKLFKSVCL